MRQMGMVAGEDCSACGVGCNGGGGRGVNNMYYVGPRQGDFAQEASYKYVGRGGDFTSVRPRRDYTCCLITGLSSLGLMLLPLLLYGLWPHADTCEQDTANWQFKWSRLKQARCCAATGGKYGCLVLFTAKPDPALGGPVDPFNCANEGAEWQAGWSDEKKSWCCSMHGKGCGGALAVPATTYDCNAGKANWVKGWSAPKKAFCCQTSTHEFCDQRQVGPGYGSGAQLGINGAPIAQTQAGFVPYARTHH